MNLLIDLYENNAIFNIIDKSKGFLHSKSFILQESLTDLATFKPETLYERCYFRDVIATFQQPREYVTELGIKVDSHIQIEKLGVSSINRNIAKKNMRTLVVSLEDSLDYILHRLCGCEYNTIYNSIEDYKRVSRGILTMNTEMLGNMKYEILSSIDPKLRHFLYNIGMESFNNDDFIYNFFATIIKESSQMIQYIIHYLKEHYESIGIRCVIKSIAHSSAVAQVDKDIDDIIELPEGYKIRCKSYKVKEFIYHINDTMRIS